MCKTKAFLVSLSFFLLVAASFCIYEAHRVKKLGQHSKIKSQSPRKNMYLLEFKIEKVEIDLIDSKSADSKSADSKSAAARNFSVKD